jgi:hypothetical protein
MTMRIWWLVTAAIVGLGLIASAVVFLSRPQSPIPVDISRQALFDLYYPSKLPAGYKVNPNSFTYQDSTVIFGATNTQGQNLAFTEQAAPAGFDFSQFYSSLKDPKKIDKVSYQVVTGEGDRGSRVVSVVAGTTWIIITSKAPTDTDDIRALAAGLRRQK